MSTPQTTCETSAKRTALFVSPSAYLLSGLATWLDYLLPGLTSRGWTAILGLVEGPRFHRPAAYLSKHPWDNAIAIPCRTGSEAGRRRALTKAIRRTRPDVVVSVNIPDVYPAVAELRASGADAPKAIMTLHGILAPLCEDVRRFGKFMDAAVCTNRLTCRLVETLGGMSPERIHYAAYGVRIGEGPPPFPKRGERLRIAYVGRLEGDQKRVFDIPPILAQLDEMGVPFELLVAGSGPEEGALVAALEPWQEQVRMLGFLSPDEVGEQVYARADCLLIPSRWETGPIVAWEAIARGVPVVCSRYTGYGLENALKDRETALLFDIGDIASAARQLAELWRDEDNARRIADNAYQMVNKRYSIPVSVETWDRTLQGILDAPPRESATVPAPRPAGRLDRFLGAGIAERLRELCGRTCPENDAGGEWPFSYGGLRDDEAAFWAHAENEDRRNDN